MRQGIVIALSLFLLLAFGSPINAQPPGVYSDVYPPDTTAPQQEQTPLNQEEIQGTVESIHGHTALIRTENGEQVRVDLGPQSYWRAHGYHLRSGMAVRVQGWHGPEDPGLLFAGGIWGPGFYIQLTNTEGFPVWVNPDVYWPGWYPTWVYYDYYFDHPPIYLGGPGPWWYFGSPHHRREAYRGYRYYERPHEGPRYEGGEHHGGRGEPAHRGGGERHGGGEQHGGERGGRRGH